METSYGKKLLRQCLSNLQTADYQTFIVLDSGGGYSDRPSEMVFNVKYDLRHKVRLVAGGKWTVNDKEHFYSGVVRMDTVRIGFFLGELTDFHVVHVTSDMPSYMEKQKKRSI
jgi:hypothetical protein